MKRAGKINLILGFALVAVFVIFTLLVKTVDLKPVGANGTYIGFSSLNLAFHRLFGVNMTLFLVTDWAGLIPIFTAASFAVLGLAQLIKRKSLTRVDSDILILGIYYLIVIALYLVFEMMPINFRPILINGNLESSYPSSTALLVICVMPTLAEQSIRRCRSLKVKKAVTAFVLAFSAFMLIARLISGVHWFTDILASLIVSAGLFLIYRGFVLIFNKYK